MAAIAVITCRFSCSSRHRCVSHPDPSLPHFSHGKLLSDLCTWGVGGPAKLFCQVHHESHLLSAIRHCREQGIRYLVIGKGSNLLFDDRGFDGCIILNRIDFLETHEPGIYRAGSGYPFNVLGMQCSRDGFSGLEFASGIPGTVGGAVYMNAGANGQETADVLKSVEVITASGNKCVFGRDELLFRYRCSPFQNGTLASATIVGASFELKPSLESREMQVSYLERRKKSQPLADRTAGCVFRNPADAASAGYLIEKAGLKGATIGGARVSQVHANFVANVGGASCASDDIRRLIALVKERVKQTSGIELEEEIVYVPYD